jgi:hypothetical protein
MLAICCQNNTARSFYQVSSTQRKESMAKKFLEMLDKKAEILSNEQRAILERQAQETNNSLTSKPLSFKREIGCLVCMVREARKCKCCGIHLQT